MQADFLNAYERHWNDAEVLRQAQCLANADHLYGISAECGLKRLMLAFGMPHNTSGSPRDRADWVHVDGVWARFESYRSGHMQGAGYSLPMNNPFDNWHASDRYAHHSNFDHARVTGHQAGAQLVCNLIKQAQRNGLI
ncbi:hypothetical protein ACSZNY_13205 [Aeromonas caviae]